MRLSEKQKSKADHDEKHEIVPQSCRNFMDAAKMRRFINKRNVSGFLKKVLYNDGNHECKGGLSNEKT